MAAGVDFLQLADGDFGVNGGRLQLLVAEQLLDETDVRAVLQHVRGATVPQRVATAFALQPGLLEPAAHHARDDIGIERLAVAGEEQRRRARVQAEPRAHFLEIAFEPHEGARDPGCPTEHVVTCARSFRSFERERTDISGQRQRSFDFCR